MNVNDDVKSEENASVIEDAFDASSFVSDTATAENKILENVAAATADDEDNEPIVENNQTVTNENNENGSDNEAQPTATSEEAPQEPAPETPEAEPTFSWDDNEDGEGSPEANPENNPQEPTTADFGDSWQPLAEQLGIKVDSFDEFKDVLSYQQQLAQKSVSNETVNNLQNFMGMSDEELMRAELKAQNYESHEIDDEIDIMIENGTIKSSARKVRKDVEAAIQQEQARLNQEIVNPSDAKLAEQQEALSQELKEYMSKTNSMFGGKINATQKDEHFEYIDSGKFFDDITDTPENVAQAAWLWKHKDRIMKGFMSKGVEKGKQAVLDDLKNPERSRSNRIPDPETGEFNMNRFMDLGEKM